MCVRDILSVHVVPDSSSKRKKETRHFGHWTKKKKKNRAHFNESYICPVFRSTQPTAICLYTIYLFYGVWYFKTRIKWTNIICEIRTNGKELIITSAGRKLQLCRKTSRLQGKFAKEDPWLPFLHIEGPRVNSNSNDRSQTIQSAMCSVGAAFLTAILVKVGTPGQNVDLPLFYGN